MKIEPTWIEGLASRNLRTIHPQSVV